MIATLKKLAVNLSTVAELLALGPEYLTHVLLLAIYYYTMKLSVYLKKKQKYVKTTII